VITPKALLIDGNYLLHRVLHFDSTNSMKYGGAFGFLDSISRTLEIFEAVDKVVAVWDGGHSKRRLAMLPEYKVKPPPSTPEEIDLKAKWIEQRTVLMSILSFFGVRVLCVPGKEGDDVIARCCYSLTDPLAVVSDDRDLLQLVCDSCIVYRPIANEIVDLYNFKDKVGVPRSMFLFVKALVGDASDRIPGIGKVGEVTAERFVNQLQKFWDREYPPAQPLEWSSLLLDGVPKACAVLVESDSRNKARYKAIESKVGDVAVNLSLVDVSQEEFTSEEVELIDRAILPPVQCNQRKILETCGQLGFSNRKNLVNWLSPFQRLR
jgi:5'-3' exonuclease